MQPKIPSNLIVTKYTSGKQYMDINTYQEYIGYYYEYARKKYVGKEFSINAPELIEISSNKINPLLNNPSTFMYGLISKVNSKNISSTKFNSLPSDVNSDLDSFDPYVNTTEESFYQYFVKKVNNSIIKQVDKNTYNQLKDNPLYQTSILNPERSNLDQMEKEIPGIKAFLNIQ